MGHMAFGTACPSRMQAGLPYCVWLLGLIIPRPQSETIFLLLLVLRDVESSLEYRSVVYKITHVPESSLSWNSIEVKHLRQGCLIADVEYLPFMTSRHIKCKVIT